MKRKKNYRRWKARANKNILKKITEVEEKKNDEKRRTNLKYFLKMVGFIGFFILLHGP